MDKLDKALKSYVEKLSESNVKMDNINPAIKNLINRGLWSLYKIDHETIKYVLHSPGPNSCCRQHSKPEKYYVVDEDGSMKNRIEGIKDLKVLGLVHNIA